ncbi:MAG: serine hydrolase [Chloroflexi bacterium]|nr:serine hydrolase [Chloroflexota bacterium]
MPRFAVPRLPRQVARQARHLHRRVLTPALAVLIATGPLVAAPVAAAAPLAAARAQPAGLSTSGGPPFSPASDLPDVRVTLSGVMVHATQDQIDGYVQERMSAWNVPGLALAIVENGRVSVTRGYGAANLTDGTPMTPHTLVAVGSTTKGVTALAVMQLAEQGTIDLDAPVTRYLPWFHLDDERSAAITVRQLLDNTSGIPASAELTGSQEPDGLERRVRALEYSPLRSAPGSRWEYANDGFNTAGLIVQVVSGVPYEQYVQEHIFGPLGMTHSTFDPAQAASLGLAQGYVRRTGQLMAAQTRLTRGYNPSGMLLTDAEDSGRYLATLLGGGALDGAQIISADSIQILWTPAASVDEHTAYGLGWFIRQEEGLKVVAHPGEILTMGSAYVLVPERNLGVAVLTNIDNDAKVEIAEGIARLLLGFEPVLRAVPAIGAANTFVPNRAVWDAYVGEYDTPQGTLRIARDSDRLIGRIQSFSVDLEALSDTQFVIHTDVSVFDETLLEFKPDPDGRMSIYVKGQRFGVKRP